MARPTSEIKAIPKRILISDPSDINCSYSSTPGGTLYSTTPGGTRIVYERAFLMNLRNSPISKTPPNWEIPNQLVKGSPSPWIKEKKGIPSKKKHQISNNVNHSNGFADDSEQFPMDI
ncbi:hypothetical protein RN001_013024 [Aquatica leii]|uniref:Uncharacterized protein n=1 Tax=Aquatica leii TaxID=1421715 RepID=A0AAN7PQ21_9COLE|nr:hypothetical protein RN001_013024 [Aquatica leii]